ncbi:MAG: hypothetical protein DMF90_29075 [Acidobacteria bacterium]|nr:MAG: hypothetical protein DMF90_29075 [Acidobacteriota bacterium]
MDGHPPFTRRLPMRRAVRFPWSLAGLPLALGAAALAVAAAQAQKTANPTQESSSPVVLWASLDAPPTKPVIVVTEDRQRLRVVPIAAGLSHPWGMAFLPDGRTLLVTERPGRLRVIREDVLDPKPVAGVPVVNNTFIGGLNDVAIHPQFEKNQYVYLSYSKGGERGGTLALARGVWRDGALTDVRDIFVADAWESTGASSSTGGGTYGGRIVFGPDGMLYLTVGDTACPGSGQPRGEGAPAARRWHGSERQPVCRPRRCQAGNLHLRASERVWPRVSSRDRRTVGMRVRTHGWG